jgi:predicted DNA-binding transcriptional regulator YafY
MARNAELIRQWEILREIDGARTGITIAKLAALRHVHQRTIRRDMQALCNAGFPLYDDRINGTAMWKLRAKPFRGLEETGLSVTELCALYFGRTMIATLAGSAFADDVDRALGKLERALPLPCRKYLDQLPVLVKAKSTLRKKHDAKKTGEIVARAVDASLTHRRLAMRYYSSSTRRVKDYVVDPLRVVYACGGMYLTAFVAEYGETRTFAIERIRLLAVLDEHFDPRPLPPEPFANSLGVHTGSPELVEIEFDADVADYVREREWHRSQEIVERDDGSVLVQLCVCVDRPLRSWILSFGAAARVVIPSTLVQEIAAETQRARDRYAVRAARFDMLKILPTPGHATGQSRGVRSEPALEAS